MEIISLFRRDAELKKIKFDKKYMKISLYCFFVLAACIVLSKFLDNAGGFFSSIGVFLHAVNELLITFIYGFFIAFFFTPIVNRIERFIRAHCKKLDSRPKLLRNLTILFTYAFFIGCFIWLMVYMLPTIFDSFNAVFASLPRNLDNLTQSLPDMLSWMGEDTRNTVINSIASLEAPLRAKLENLPETLKVLSNRGDFDELINNTMNVVMGVLNFLIGIIISFYMLASKERIADDCKKFCLAIFEDSNAERFIQNMRRVNMIFQSFILGKLLDAIALGIMCFIGMAILRIPYAVAISVTIGVTNMIPYVGPFIGTVPAVFIVLLASPIKALWLFIYIIVIQQIDNYIVCPRLLGDPTGLTPLEVLFAIAVGAYFKGAFGMFIGVPVVASIKLFTVEAVNRRFREKYPHGAPVIPQLEEDEEDDYDDIPEE